MEGENFADWRPKMEVAEALGISERTLERLIQQKRIRRAYRRVSGRKPLAVLHPDDVAALKADTVPVSSAPPIEPRTTDVALRATPQPDLAALLAGFNTTSVPLHRKIYLTIAEAAALSGLPKAYLKRQIRAGVLPAVRVPSWRIRREDLDGHRVGNP